MYRRNICFKNGFIVFGLCIRSKDLTEIELFTDYATRFLLSSGGNIDTLSMSTWSAKLKEPAASRTISSADPATIQFDFQLRPRH